MTVCRSSHETSTAARCGMVAAGGRLPDLPAQLRRLERRRHRRPARDHQPACGYLRELGVDAVWLSPFYPSALADGGYDVDDHRDVDPRIGTLEQFDEHASPRCTAAGIRLIVDIVPNHTSNRHVWFHEALASAPGSPARERYIFRRGERPARRAAAERLDLDLRRARLGAGRRRRVVPAPVRARAARPELGRTTRCAQEFLDDAEVLGRPRRRRLPHRRRARAGQGPHRARCPARRTWTPTPARRGAPARRTATRSTTSTASGAGCSTSYDPPRTAVAEAWVPAHRRSRYASPEGLGQAFNFDLLAADWDATTFQRSSTRT